MSEDDEGHDDAHGVDDVDREAILARRARFVATALVGMTMLPACDPFPKPCLNIAEVPPAPSASAEPTPSSSAAPAPTASAAAGVAPQPCLDIAPPPPSAGAASASSTAKVAPTSRGKREGGGGD